MESKNGCVWGCGNSAAAGCPVTCLNDTAFPEICGYAAIYCDPKDPADDIAKRWPRCTAANFSEIHLLKRARKSRQIQMESLGGKSGHGI